MNPLPFDLSLVSDAASLQGDDEEDTRLLRSHLEEARHFIESHKWCREVREVFFGGGIGGIVAVFLFRLPPSETVDEWIWVVVGNLPSAYLVTDRAPTPRQALDVYCELMEDWAAAVLDSGDLSEVFPVAAAPTIENAKDLRKRIRFVRRHVLERLP